MSAPDQRSVKGPIGIFWDIENCGVPSDVLPEDVSGNIRTAIKNNAMIEGEVTLFSAFADLVSFSTRFRECFYRTGVKIVDVPNNRKEAADKAILVDMFLFALDNRPPSSVMLITGDADFAPTLHILGQRGYNVILVIPTGVRVSSALRNPGRFVWDWPSLAHGKGFVIPCYIPAQVCCSSVKKCVEIQEEPKSLSESSCSSKTTSLSSEASQSAKISSSLPGTSATDQPSTDKSEATIVQQGDIDKLKCQLVKLLELADGCLPLNDILNEYKKLFHRPLTYSEYGAEKLIQLLEKFSDAIGITGKNDNKAAYLLRSASTEPPSCSLGMPEQPRDIKALKSQVLKLLKLSGGRLPLDKVPKVYAKLFQRPLVASEYGAKKLINLVEMISDDIVIRRRYNNRAVCPRSRRTK